MWECVQKFTAVIGAICYVAYVGAAANASFELYIDGMSFFNLTKAGKTKAEMDAIVQNSGYFDRISI